MGHSIFNVRVWSLDMRIHRDGTSAYNLIRRVLWGIKSVENFDYEENRRQSAHKASHETVTHPWGDHAWSCLTMAFESECFRCALLTPFVCSFCTSTLGLTVFQITPTFRLFSSCRLPVSLRVAGGQRRTAIGCRRQIAMRTQVARMTIMGRR